jgi:hypothetical protein
LTKMQSASRSRKVLLAIIVAAALCGSVLGYLLSLPTPKGLTVTLTSPPIELSFSLDKRYYSFAENMTLSFYLRNISNETVILSKSTMMEAAPGELVTEAKGVTIDSGQNLLTALFHFGFILYSSNGTVIAAHVDGSSQAAYEIILQPNASLNQTTTGNLAYTVNENGRMQRAAGAYRISAVLKAGMNNSRYQWETPSITFTLG